MDLFIKNVGEGFIFAVEIYSFFSCTASTAVHLGGETHFFFMCNSRPKLNK